MAGSKGLISTRDMAKDKGGQLLLTTGMLLAVLLMGLASITTNSTSTVKEATHDPSLHGSELNDVAVNFKKSLDIRSNQLSLNSPSKTAIGEAFEEVSEEFASLMSTRNVIFQTSRSQININTPEYTFNVTLTLMYKNGEDSFLLSQDYDWKIELDKK